jgi:Uma2 family endonuclease
MVVRIEDKLSLAEETRMIAALAAVKDHVLLRRVSWKTYQALLEAWGSKTPRHTYDRGSLEIMAKSSMHEIFKSVIGLLLSLYCHATRRGFVNGGETTLDREELDRGIEPDQCFWIAHADHVEGKLMIDFDVDPVPDLFIEVEVSRTIIDRLRVLAALGIPEVWRFDGTTIHVGVLQDDATYDWCTSSPTFPELSMSGLVEFIGKHKALNHMKIMDAFYLWLAENKPR